MAFQICLNTSTIRPVPIIEKIRLAAKHGFVGVELWLNDIYEYIGRGGEVRDVEKELSDQGLFVPCTIAMRSWGEASNLEYPLQLDECKRRMELAARIGSPNIVATPPREPEDVGQITERYKDLLELGRGAGVRPLFEYISFFKSVPTLKLAVEIAQAVEDKDAAIILDAFHTWNAGGDLDDVKNTPLELIAHYHFDDGDPVIPRGEQTDPNRVMPGEGPIDLEAEVAVLKELGYEGTVSLELFNPGLWGKDPNEVLQMGMERMRQYFG